MRHPIINVLTIAVLGCMCGCDDAEALEDWGEKESDWLVENQLHWCLDMTFGQDANRTRTGNAAENFAVVRHFALNIIRNYKGDRYSVPRRRRLSDFRRDYRSQVLQAAVGG